MAAPDYDIAVVGGGLVGALVALSLLADRLDPAEHLAEPREDAGEHADHPVAELGPSPAHR